jgi:hypothetical protein
VPAGFVPWAEIFECWQVAASAGQCHCWVCTPAPLLLLRLQEKVVGFRAPFLVFDSNQRDILQQNGACGGFTI